jgi:hypothetical protein
MSLQHRPTFSIDLPGPVSAVAERLRAALEDGAIETRWSRTPGARTEHNDEHVYVLVRHRERRFWSPWLHLEVYRQSVGAQVFGRFSPHPSVWAAYLLGYLLLGTVTFLASMFGAAQALSVGRPTALWALPFTGTVALLMWWSSQVGQRLARDEMADLRARVDAAIG